MPEVSIIIPTLNEGDYLARSLRCLTILDPPAKEVVVVDGGSADNTLSVLNQHSRDMVHPFDVTVVECDHPCRATQMNLGAKRAKGDVLCFLHGDTLVPDDLVALVETTLADPGIACGGFISLMAGDTTRWLTSLHNSFKTYYAALLFHPILFFRNGFRVLFGDQVMFCRRQDFWACGGFDASLTIMEEADLCIKLSRRGRIVQVNRTVVSSDRRVAKWGTLKANFIYLMIGFLWGMGVSDTALRQFYEDVR